MKTTFCISLLVLFLCVSDQVQSVPLAYRTLSPEEVCSSKSYIHFSKLDPEHYKTIVFLSEIPPNQQCQLKLRRPLLGMEVFAPFVDFISPTVDAVNTEAEPPSYVMSGRGFLPGEEVELLIEAPVVSYRSLIVLTPQPVKVQSRKDGALFSAKLIDTQPTKYLLSLKGFLNGEKLQLDSYSRNKKLSSSFVITGDLTLGVAPAVSGATGGYAKLILSRRGGECLSLILPWGTALGPYFHGEKNPGPKVEKKERKRKRNRRR